ncbi:retrovirus-related pol polyprotein from transposon TNT 1-94 [Tanacetum coccineum]
MSLLNAVRRIAITEYAESFWEQIRRLDSTGYSLKDKKEAKPDKTEHGIGKSAKNRGQGTYNGIEFVNQTLREYYEKVGISHETFVVRSPQQNGVIKRRNHMLINAARTMFIYAKAPLFLWAEAVATACYTQNRSIVRLHHGKTPYELLHDKPPDLTVFHVFGALCYSINNSENLDFDELAAMTSKHSSSGPALHEMTPATISLGLVPNPPPLTFVDYPASEVVALIHKVVAPVSAVSTGSSFSTNVDQDAPSPSHSQTTPKTQPLIIPNNVEEDI